MVADPADRALDDPSLGQHDKAMLVAASDDLHFPWPGSLHGCGHLRPLVTGIADDPFDEWELPTSLAQQRFSAIAVLDVSRVNHHAQQQTERVGQDVALATKRLLSCIITRWVERRPPF